jgi:predicted nucleotide-binding protein
LLELAHEVDFAALIFAPDDWTSATPSGSPAPDSGQASPRDSVVFEAGLFGGALGMRRAFILHASGSPEDVSVLDGFDDRRCAELIAPRLKNWKSITSA